MVAQLEDPRPQRGDVRDLETHHRRRRRRVARARSSRPPRPSPTGPARRRRGRRRARLPPRPCATVPRGARRRVEVVGDDGRARRPDHWLPVHPVHPERPGGLLVEVEADQVPPAAAEPQQGGRHMTRVAAVVEGHRRPPAHCVVEHRQGRQRGEVGERLHPRRGRQAQAPQRIATTRIAEVDPGYGKVQGRLLVRVRDRDRGGRSRRVG